LPPAWLAALSLLLPSQPSYDPFAWLVWGREIAHGSLDTTGGSSWKPLPVVFTSLFAPFSRVDDATPVALWMLVARTGALFALVLAFRLASRLAGGGVTGAIGGAVAATTLFVLPDWLQFSAHGSEAPWAVALTFWAIERHLDSRRDHAFGLGVLACLLRPELVPFLGVYTLWLWWAEPRLRPLVAGCAAVSAAAWLVPEWIGAGNPLDGARQATGEPVWSLSHAERPWLAALELGHDHAGLVVELLALAAVVWALLARRLEQQRGDAFMTQAGFSRQPALRPAGARPHLRAGRGGDGSGARRRRQADRGALAGARRSGRRRGAGALGRAIRERAHGSHEARGAPGGCAHGAAPRPGPRGRPARRAGGRERTGDGDGQPRLPQPPRVGSEGADQRGRGVERTPPGVPLMAGAERRPGVHDGSRRHASRCPPGG
jgi:hypothetical protein